MPDRFAISLQQLNPVVGDLAGNRALAEAAVRAAGDVDLVVFSELFISGYPPEDLVLRRSFAERAMAEVRELARALAGGPAVAIGTPWREDGRLTNALAVLKDGEVRAVRHKVELPNYDVFDEKRVFSAGPLPGPVDIEGVRVGFPIGEDFWEPDVVDCLAETGADILVVPTGSPFTRAKQDVRMSVAVARVVESGLPLACVNQVGGQDELVFDGASFVLSAARTLALQLPAFAAAAGTVVFVQDGDGWRPEPGAVDALPDLEEADWRAAMLGLADYVDKNGFSGVVVALSGGVDAAVAAALAVDALGPDRVRGVILPDTVDEDFSAAAAVAALLGVRAEIVPIAPCADGFSAQLGAVSDAARQEIRGATLAAIAAGAGALVLATGDKSAMALGAAPPWGAFNPIKDFYRTELLRLARWRNGTKPAGALGPDGEVFSPAGEGDATLDAILKRLIEDEASVADIVGEGFDAATVRRVEDLLHRAEATRRQSAPGVKVSGRTFGRDRRYPVTNRFRDA